MQSINTCLSIQDLRLTIHLGWPEAERAQAQTIHVDIKIKFTNPPKACGSDHLDDTVCYATLIEKINKYVKGRTFCLIEHVAQELFIFVKQLLPLESHLLLHITKYPPIAGLEKGVRFSFGDAECSF